MAVGFAAFAAGAQVVNTLATTGMSFAQAAEARRDIDRANQEVAVKTAQLMRGLDVNVYEALPVPKKDRELKRRALLTAAADAMDVARQGETRGAGAAAARTLGITQQGLETDAAIGEQRQIQLDKLIAAEQSRLNDLKSIVRMEQIEGAQLAKREAAEMRQKSLTEGFQGVTATLGAAASFVPLFQKTKAARLAKQALKRNPQLQEQLAKQGAFGGVDTSGVADMSPMEFRDFITDEDRFTIDQLKELRDKRTFVDTSLIMDAGNITMPGIGMSPFDATGLQGEVSQELIDLLGYTPTPTIDLATDPRLDRKIMFNPNK
jgi:hypothetical protein